jgi:hypothetical protein
MVREDLLGLTYVDEHLCCRMSVEILRKGNRV